MNRPCVVRHPNGSVELTFPYDALLIEAIKAQIPAHARTYDPAVKSWTVTALHSGLAIRLMQLTFGEVTIVGANHSPTDAYRVLHLLPTAPPELVAAAHRCLAKLHHPDRGGSTAAMQRLNAAVEQIRSAS